MNRYIIHPQKTVKRTKSRMKKIFPIVFRPSNHEGSTTQGVFLTDEVKRSSIAEQMDGEVCHIHATGDYAVHVVLAPEDCTRQL